MKHLIGIIFLVLVISPSSFAKSTTWVTCLVTDSQADFKVHLENNKIQFARYFDKQSPEAIEVQNPKVTNSDKLFSLSGKVDKKSFRFEVDLSSSDTENGSLNFAHGKPQSLSCVYTETGLNI